MTSIARVCLLSRQLLPSAGADDCRARASLDEGYLLPGRWKPVILPSEKVESDILASKRYGSPQTGDDIKEDRGRISWIS
jgi:hypothetical protein